ncbi:MAG: 5'-nucleotidase [Wolinella sp.]
MPIKLSNTLVIGISSTALFDLREVDSIFRKEYENNPCEAMENYRKHMLEKENDELAEGTGYPLVKALLSLNKYQNDNKNPLVEVVVMSRNSPETGIRILNAIRKKGLQISRSAFTAGESVVDYLEAFDVDLFLTTDHDDAQKVIDSKICAVAIVKEPPKCGGDVVGQQVRIAFDGDAVLFDESSEWLYKTQGIEVFHANEDEKQDIPLNEGPYASFLKKLSALQKKISTGVELSPIRIALITARNSPADIRVIKTLRNWGVYVDEAFFLGGVSKDKVLKAFRPHIFFDDQDIHLDDAAQLVPSGKVPYSSKSKLK